MSPQDSLKHRARVWRIVLFCLLATWLGISANVKAAMPMSDFPVVKKDPVPSDISELLAPYWDQFPMVDGPQVKKTFTRELPPINPKRNGSICSDGWRRLMFNFEPVRVHDKRFAGFRFKYEGKDGDDLSLIFQTPPLVDQQMEWAIISSKGKMISFPMILQAKANPGLAFQFLDSEFLETGETYLIWFQLAFDFPVEYRFRLSLANITPAMQEDPRQIVQTLTKSAEMDMRIPPAHPMTHLGIGITVAKQPVADKGLLVTDVIMESPAAEAKLQRYFLILKINGQSTADMSVSEFQTILQDPFKETVELTWRSNLHKRGEPAPIVTWNIHKRLIAGKAYQEMLEGKIHLSLAAGMLEPGAAYRLAEMYWKKRYSTDAIKWYKKAAGQDDLKAMLALGHVYSGGVVEPDEPQATDWFTRAASLGDITAAYEAARRYEDGKGTPVDLEKAAALYLQAAREGKKEASAKIGEFYRLGKGVKQDQKLAVHWLEQSAEQGNTDAAYQLGLNCMDKQAYLEASRWYQIAADGGNPKAGVALAELYETGKGVMKNDILAEKLYSQFARNDTEARYRYAVYLRKRNQVNSNRVAQFHLIKASRVGHLPSQRLLAEDGLDWTQLKLPSEE